MANIELAHSVWRPAKIEATTAPLEGDITADVVVIGGGMSGLSCAYYLARSGADVVLLEREAVGSQSSTRNYGILETAWGFGDAPLEQRRQWARFARSTIPALRKVLDEEGFECDLKSNYKYWMPARAATHVKQARAQAEELQLLGYEAGYAEREEMDSTTAPYLGSLWKPQTEMNPYKLVQGFKQAVLRRGVRVFENSEVIELLDGDVAQAITKRGKVTARKAVIAMNAFSVGFGVTGNYALPVQIFSLITHPIPDDIAAAIGPKRGESILDLGDPATERRFTQRFMPNGRLFFGGGVSAVPSRDALFTPALSEENANIIKAELFRRYPVLKPEHIDFWWGGAICRPVGERPIIGAVPGTESLLLSLICNGKGMAVGSSAGRLITETISPGSSGDADTVAFLDYCKPRTDVLTTLEGAMFKVLQGPARTALNIFLKK